MSLLFVLPSFSKAASTPYSFDGEYDYSGESLLVVRDVELVYSSDRARLKVLQSEGFQCLLQTAVYRCTKFLHDEVIPSTIVAEIKSTYKNFNLVFLKSFGDPVLTNDSELLKEWDILDQVKIESNLINNYRYYFLVEQNIHKFKIELNDQKFWFIASDGENFYTPLKRIQKSSNSKRERIFDIAVNFSKI